MQIFVHENFIWLVLMTHVFFKSRCANTTKNNYQHTLPLVNCMYKKSYQMPSYDSKNLSELTKVSFDSAEMTILISHRVAVMWKIELGFNSLSNSDIRKKILILFNKCTDLVLFRWKWHCLTLLGSLLLSFKSYVTRQFAFQDKMNMPMII